MIIVSLIVDVVLTLVFAIVGRASHAESLDAAGVAQTWWPFLVALVVGWIVSLAWRRPRHLLRTGVPLWIVTVAGGMLLRAATGAGTAVPFIIVATVALAILLIGWRLIAAAVVAVRHRSER